MKTHLLFLSRWIREPLTTGALFPSGRDLAKAMAEHLSPGDGWTLELGGGTGSITRALLSAGVAPEKLLVIEKDPILCLHLAAEFPHCRIIQGDAGDLPSVLERADIQGPFRTVVSGLPLLSMPSRLRHRILANIFSLKLSGGSFIQFSYSPFCPVSDDFLEKHRVRASRTHTIWTNFPPASVWRFDPELVTKN